MYILICFGIFWYRLVFLSQVVCCSMKIQGHMLLLVVKMKETAQNVQKWPVFLQVFSFCSTDRMPERTSSSCFLFPVWTEDLDSRWARVGFLVKFFSVLFEDNKELVTDLTLVERKTAFQWPPYPGDSMLFHLSYDDCFFPPPPCFPTTFCGTDTSQF